MQSKPELTVFSIYLMGGGASFHRNMIENRPDDTFNIQCIFLNPLHWVGKRSDNVVLEEKDCVFEFSAEPLVNIAKRLEKLISKHEGAIITNLRTASNQKRRYPFYTTWCNNPELSKKSE